jgi:site-specific DNA recombinase
MTAATLTRPTPAASYAAGAVVSYERISRFRVEDLNTEVTRQVVRQAADADEAAARLGLGPVVHIQDEGFSASRFATKARDGWADVLAMVTAGEVSWVLVWVLDRALRQTRDLDDLLDACRATGARVLQTATGTVVDPNNPDSVAMAKIAGVLAETEVAKMSMRVRRAHAAKAEAGQFHGGQRRFGFNADMTATDEAEAAEIRDAAARVLAGESLRSLAADWNARGVLTVSGGEWRSQNLGLMLRRPHLAKLRTHKGATVPASWDAPAILDAATHEAVTRFLTNPTRRNSPTSAGTRVHALSGVLRCGVCDNPMHGRPTPNGYGPAYVCRHGQHVQAPTAKVDDLVWAAMTARLSRVDAAGAWVDPVDAEAANARAAERANLTTNRRATVTDVLLAPADKADALAAIDARLTELAAADDADNDAAHMASRVLVGLVGHSYDETAAMVGPMDDDRRRAVLAALGGVPVLGRASRRGRGLDFEPGRVTFRWPDEG